MLDVLLFALIVTACGFGPGFFLVRRLRWDPAETFVGAIALSLVLLYVVAFIGFWLELEAWFNYAITLVAALLLAVSARDAAALLRRPQLRHVVPAFLSLQVWLLGGLLLIRHYSGGDSCCDWVEHYQRTQHFIDRLPEHFAYINVYSFTARPPLQNLVAAHALAQVHQNFALYQVVFTLLASLMFLPCALFARYVAPRGFNHPMLLAVVLGANPMFFVNATYPWTKMLTAFFVVLGVWFYLRGWARPGRRYLPFAFLCLGAGILVHYSAVPYAMFLGGHYVVVLWRRQRRPWMSLAAVVGPASAMLALWFGWALLTYGPAGTFLANSTVAGLAPADWWTNLATVATNIAGTLRPQLFEPQPGHTWLRALTDRTFMLYQVNLFFGVGSVAGLVALWSLGPALLHSPWTGNPGGRLFWASFIVFNVVVGVAVHTGRQSTGLAFVGLQPLIYMAVTLVVVSLPHLARWARLLLFGGVVTDFVLGVVLQVHMQHEMAQWARTPNWDWKRDYGLVYLGDYTDAWAPAIKVVLAAAALVAIGYAVGRVWPERRTQRDSSIG